MYAKLTERGLYKEASRYGDCRRRNFTLVCRRCAGRHKQKFTCNLRCCLKCADVYSWKLRQKYADLIRESGLAERIPNGWRWKLLTVTLSHTGDVKERIEKIRSCFGKLWAELWGSDPRSGCIYTIEIAGSEHIHMHILLIGRYYHHETITDHWLRITGDSWICDIRQVRKGINGGLKYVLSYITKGLSDIDAETAIDRLILFKRCRRYGTKGALYRMGWKWRLTVACAWCAGTDGCYPDWADQGSFAEYRDPIPWIDILPP